MKGGVAGRQQQRPRGVIRDGGAAEATEAASSSGGRPEAASSSGGRGASGRGLSWSTSTCATAVQARARPTLTADPGQGRTSVLSHASNAHLRIAKLVPSFDTGTLVEIGVCCLRERTRTPLRSVTLWSQSVMHAQPWGDLTKQLMDYQADASARGNAFESCATPVIDAVFSTQIAVDAHKFATVPLGLKGGWRGNSACGVLMRSCVEIADLAEWARASQAARFDGQVAPMARPSTGLGADLLVLVRKS